MNTQNTDLSTPFGLATDEYDARCLAHTALEQFQDDVEEAHYDAGHPLTIGAYNSILHYDILRDLILSRGYTVAQLRFFAGELSRQGYLSPGIKLLGLYVESITDRIEKDKSND